MVREKIYVVPSQADMAFKVAVVTCLYTVLTVIVLTLRDVQLAHPHIRV